MSRKSRSRATEELTAELLRESAAEGGAVPTGAAQDTCLEKSEIEGELQRLKERSRFRQTLKNTLYTLITIAALATIIAVFLLPVFQVHGNAMSPTLQEGQILLSVRDSSPKRGDVVACYYGNKLVLRRCIAVGGDEVSVAEDGTVTVNGQELTEPYVSEAALGTCDAEFPLEVPAGECFLMGDNRALALDSRTELFGTIACEQIAGRVIFCLYPFDSFGPVRNEVA